MANASDSELKKMVDKYSELQDEQDRTAGNVADLETDFSDKMDKISDFDVFICDNSKPYSYIINDKIFESYIKVVKMDAESGKTIPYAGAGFQIYDADNTLITMSVKYPSNMTIDTFYTDSNGSLITPEKLVYGKGYKLVEVQAPYGYVLDKTPVYFDVTKENSTNEGGVTLIKVNKADTPQKGKITISKEGEVFYGVNVSGGIDENGNEIPTVYQPVYETAGLEGATYEIRAAEDIITPDGTIHNRKGDLVDTVTTGKDGIAVSKTLYLGKYSIKETHAPYGMVLNDEVHTVELTYADQTVKLTQTATSFFNDRQKVKVNLEKWLETNEVFDIGTNGEIKNISFGLFAEKEMVSASGTSIPADGLIEIIALAMGADFMMLGRYFARFDESPTTKLNINGTYVKEYWGEGSNRARNWQRYDLGGKSKLSFEEGVDSYVTYAGPLKDNVAKSLYKVKSTMCNCGVTNIPDLQKNAKLTVVSSTSIVEGGCHDVMLKSTVQNNR